MTDKTEELKLPPHDESSMAIDNGFSARRYAEWFARQAQKDALLWAAEFCASNAALITVAGPDYEWNIGRRAESRSLAILLRQHAEGMK